MQVRFEWDEDKARSNLRKHKISFEERRPCFMIPGQLRFPIRIIRLGKIDLSILAYRRRIAFWLSFTLNVETAFGLLARARLHLEKG